MKFATAVTMATVAQQATAKYTTIDEGRRMTSRQLTMTEGELWDDLKRNGDPEVVKELEGESMPDGAYDQNDLTYWTDMVQIALKTYVPYFEANMRSDGLSSDHPGTNTRSYIAHSEIVKRIADLPVKQEAGEVIRGNELGLLRLNTAFYPECEGEEYCGIALGATQADHKFVRPVLDEVFGDGQDGVMGTSGHKWAKADLLTSAKGFLASKNTLDVKNNAGMWTTIVLHKTALGIDMTEAEAQAFVDFQGKAVILTALPSFVPSLLGGVLGLDATLESKARYLTQYEAAIRKQVASGAITKLDASHADYDHHVAKTAQGLLDALIFAGGLSVPGVIHGGLAAYYTGLTTGGTVDFDINNPAHAPLLVMESIRNYPPVLGVPYIEKEDGFRHAPLAGMGGYDQSVHGKDATGYDATEFKIRHTIEKYHETSTDWADSGAPVADAPWSSRICPAKSMSYNMALVFWEALDATNWYVDADTEISRENGPVWWSPFTIHRSCEAMGVHVGAFEASRAHANRNSGESCSWFSWCGDGFECNRKWWQYSGKCALDGSSRFLEESCSSNDQCDNVHVQNAGGVNVDLACRFNVCAFVDGNECLNDPGVTSQWFDDEPTVEPQGTAGAWVGVAGVGGGIGAAAVFMLKKPERHLKHAKMEEAADNKL